MADRATQFFTFASRQGALPFVLYAFSASTNVERRTSDVSSSIQAAKALYTELERDAQTVGSDYLSLIAKTKDFHSLVLGIVRELSVLAETLFTSLSVVKNDYRKLPFAVLQKVSPWPEVHWARRMPVREARKLFLFPKPSAVFKAPERRKILRESSVSALRRISQAFCNVARFYERYVHIFNKYKHTISEQTGYTEIINNADGSRALKTLVFFEDYPPPKRRKRVRRRPTTWGIVAGQEMLSYLDTVLRDLTALHKLVLIARLDYIHNQGRPFIPAVGHFLGDEELEKLSNAVNQEATFRTISQVAFRTNLEWDPALRQRAEEVARRKNWVFKMNRHVFSSRKSASLGNIQASLD